MNEPALIRRLVSRALQGSEDLSTAERAELYLAASVVLRTVDAHAAEVARHTYTLLGEAQRHQMEFRELLSFEGHQID